MTASSISLMQPVGVTVSPSKPFPLVARSAPHRQWQLGRFTLALMMASSIHLGLQQRNEGLFLFYCKRKLRMGRFLSICLVCLNHWRWCHTHGLATHSY